MPHMNCLMQPWLSPDEESQDMKDFEGKDTN